MAATLSLPTPDCWLTPAWHPHPRVRACVTTRQGDFSPAPWAGFNLGLNCEDDPARVHLARTHVQSSLGLQHIGWLTQVHGIKVVDTRTADTLADASLSTQPHQACAILTADCLPVLFARTDGTAVAAAHAGWRGLASGVLLRTLARLRADSTAAICAWLGPAICQSCYQVDERVRQAFLADNPCFEQAFQADGPLHYRLSLAQAASLQLQDAGVDVTASGLCTHCDNSQFYSFRHEAGHTGRFASLIWLA